MVNNGNPSFYGSGKGSGKIIVEIFPSISFVVSLIIYLFISPGNYPVII